MNNNGRPKITVIVRFDHSVVAISRQFGKQEFSTLEKGGLETLRRVAEARGFEITPSHIHPAGASMLNPQPQERERSVAVLRSVGMGTR